MSEISRPVRLVPILKDALWGEDRLCDKFGFARSGGLAEAWLMAACRENISDIADSDARLCDIYSGDGDFPLLIKLIGAARPLSVQVHPCKNELWYVLDCDEGAEIVYGLSRDVSRDDMRRLLSDGEDIGGYLNVVKVKPGDVFYIPSGMVHALGGGITVAEIQQSSDITYRLYDYNRLQRNGLPRQLHIAEGTQCMMRYTPAEADALRVERGTPSKLDICPTGDGRSRSIRTLACSESFSVLLLSVDGSIEITCPSDTFSAAVWLSGEGSIGGEAIRRGDCVYLPEGCGELKLSSGGSEILLIYPM